MGFENLPLESSGLTCALAGSGVATLNWAVRRFGFALHLRVGLSGREIAIPALFWVLSSFTVRTAIILGAWHVAARVNGALDWLRQHGPLVVSIGIFAMLVAPPVSERILNLLISPETSLRAKAGQWSARLLQLDEVPWVEIERLVQSKLLRRTKDLRERIADGVERLFENSRTDVDRHIRRSRWLRYVGWHRYRDAAQGLAGIGARDLQRIELLVNALGFPRLERLARTQQWWRTNLRRSDRVRLMPPWPTRVRVAGSHVDASIENLSSGGLGLRLVERPPAGTGPSAGQIIDGWLYGQWLRASVVRANGHWVGVSSLSLGE